ncbi:MAG TPA: GAF domain-containing protein [Desulfonatronum sp.]|nr:GAF domain-containing protein [Desulfonatronum sp.]
MSHYLCGMSNKDCLRHLLSIIANAFDAYSAVLFLVDSPEEYCLASSFSLGDDLLQGAKIVPGKGLVGWVLRNNQPLLVNNFELQSESLGYYSGRSESVVKAFMGCPLKDGQGALCVDSKKSYSFSTKDQKILHQFADFIIMLQLDTSRTESSRKDFRYYHALQQLQGLRKRFPLWTSYLKHFLHILSQTTEIEHVLFAARDEYGQNFFLEGWTESVPLTPLTRDLTFPIGSGLVGWVFKNDTSVFVADNESGHTGSSLFARELFPSLVMHTVICLPLTVHKKTRAVLVLADCGIKEASPEMRNFLHLITEYLEFFLENLYLKNQLVKLKGFLPQPPPVEE